MRVAVLGGGVVGVATAYYLAEDGHEVTVIDRNPQPASETSYANAGLVAPGDSYAWASPDSLKIFVKSLVRRDLGIKVRPRLDPRLMAWTWKFVLQCTHARARINTLRKLRVTMYSRECLNTLVARTGIDYDGRQRGILYCFRSPASLDHGVTHLRLLADHGLAIEVVDRTRLIEIEPALASARDKLAGAIFSPMDQTGDSRKFARRLAEWCAAHRGVRLAHETRITGFEVEGGAVRGVVTDRGRVEAEAYVLAAGCDGPLLAERLGVRLPIYPVKGYSLTIPLHEDQRAPGRGVVDEDNLIAFSRLGDRLRMSSTAEFAGFDRTHEPSSFRSLITVARELFPDCMGRDEPEYWAGLRPMTPSSVPIFGRARYDNFFLNVGHGHVGWTMACGSGKLVADLVAGRRPEIDPEGLLYAE